MAYTKIGWINDRSPAINQDNLNHMDQGIYDAHQMVTLLDTLRFRKAAFLSMYDSGLSSLQGITTMEDRYLLVIRYEGNDRHFKVYDIIDKVLLNDTIFTDAQVGHCNSAAYYNGKVYVATINTNCDIVSLVFNQADGSLSYGEVVYTGGINANSLAVHGGEFWLSSYTLSDGKFQYYKTTDFNTVELGFKSDFDGLQPYLVSQGMDFDGNYLYITFSATYQGSGSGSALPRLSRLTELIYVVDTDGNILRCWDFPRGTYSEIEDVSTITVNGQHYIFVGFNQDTGGVTNVFVSPLTADTTMITQFDQPDFDDALFYGDYLVTYLDTTSGTDFGDGSAANPFKAWNCALSFIRRANVPVKLSIKGSFGNAEIHNIKVPLCLSADAATSITSLAIYGCPSFYFDSNNAITLGSLSINYSTVYVRSGLNLVGSGTQAISIYRSVLTGGLTQVTGFTNLLAAFNSIVSLTVGTVGYSGVDAAGSATRSLVLVNGKLYNITLA